MSFFFVASTAEIKVRTIFTMPVMRNVRDCTIAIVAYPMPCRRVSNERVFEPMCGSVLALMHSVFETGILGLRECMVCSMADEVVCRMTDVVTTYSSRSVDDRSAENITSACVGVLSMRLLHLVVDDGELVGGVACSSSAGESERSEKDCSNDSAGVAAREHARVMLFLSGELFIIHCGALIFEGRHADIG